MVLRRVRDMFVASVNEGLDKLENPRVMLNQYVRDMEDDVAKAKHAIIKQQTIQQGFLRKAEETEAFAEKRKKQAELAYHAGEEELARKALTEMKYFEEKHNEYQEAYQQSVKQLKELKEQLQHLETKLRDIKDKKQALIARANAAQAKQHMNDSINKVDSESAYKEFLRMENRIEEMETKAGSYAQFADQGAYAHLDYADEVEEEWQKLKLEKKPEQQQANV
ncbi:PspA/IM30 family protein [Bacillus safensis]|uniref:stress responsive protein LiaH n=1 Tax=Bacillus safensis TaxID=561879 RepID=UPI002B25402F|nr:PspA/IM30 family protein [Bacillus safensis]MEB2270825.1 PspA/IM30 family protein [Bacillus safensis]